jgi:hypothetical protein
MTRDADPNVELIYSPDCPNVDLARGRLTEALSSLGQVPAWTEWNRESPTAPGYVRRYGSPTVLVDGRDVLASPASMADSCRVYASDEGFDRAPSVQALIDALSGRA